MGDLPIYVAHDSADVWAHPELFQLDERGNPAVMSGVPPDYFSATGQLWGNPIYRWDRMAETGYEWWMRARSRRAAESWIWSGWIISAASKRTGKCPPDEKTAMNGRWVKGPGAALFEAVAEGAG